MNTCLQCIAELPQNGSQYVLENSYFTLVPECFPKNLGSVSVEHGKI